VFEARAARTPDAIAITEGQRRLTYRELNDQANRLAHQIIRHGARPEHLIGVCLERSMEFVVAILAVLKAGAAYLPLDPVYPAERLAFMIKDSRARLLITTPELRSKVNCDDVEAIQVDLSSPVLPGENVGNPNAEMTTDNLAYVIYTSGSTGQPKGVLVTHHNVVRLFKQTEHWYKFDANDVWTLFHSLSFDFSVWELWGALFYGGRLVVVPYMVSRSPREFYELLAKEKVTVLNQTPSAFRQLMWAEATETAHLPLCLRLVIFGGEALELHSLQPWFDRHGDEMPLLVNMYGITETTVHVTYRVIRQADLAKGLGSVIGAPIPDLRVYLVDERLQPVPQGVPGEILVAGAGVARGYLNRPELTGQRFLSDAFSGQDGARLYRSGDLARYTAGGELEYLGRIDNQVKIRGFRIELGEIESALNDHPAVRESLVIARNGPDGGQHLVAYLVMDKKVSCSAKELRRYLQARLPDYMIPLAHVFLNHFPLNSNGKVARETLPAPDLSARVVSEYVAPRNEIESKLARFWQEALGLERVGIEDDFFEVGGDSLLATTLAFQIEQEFGKPIPVLTVFEAPTVREMADKLGHATPLRVEGIVPLFVSGKGPKLLFLNGIHRKLGQELSPELRTFGVYCPVEEAALTLARTKRFELSTEDLASRYVKIIRDFQKEGPYFLAGYSYGGVLAFEVAAQLRSLGQEIAFLGLLDAVHFGGLKPRPFPWLAKLSYHVRECFRNGPSHLAGRLKLIRRRKSKRVDAQRRSGSPDANAWENKMAFLVLADRRYRAKPYPGSVLLVKAVGMPASFAHWPDPTNGWGGVVQGQLDTIAIPAIHEEFLDDSHIKEVANALRDYIQQLTRKQFTISCFITSLIESCHDYVTATLLSATEAAPALATSSSYCALLEQLTPIAPIT
jgi:amino acid adenylation domain-containing protein